MNKEERTEKFIFVSKQRFDSKQQGTITDLRKSTKRKPATITIIISDDLVEKLMEDFININSAKSLNIVNFGLSYKELNNKSSKLLEECKKFKAKVPLSLILANIKATSNK